MKIVSENIISASHEKYSSVSEHETFACMCTSPLSVQMSMRAHRAYPRVHKARADIDGLGRVPKGIVHVIDLHLSQSVSRFVSQEVSEQDNQSVSQHITCETLWNADDT
jgi:hypothetical protein